MLDMGKYKGTQLWYTGGRSLAELMEAGEVFAIPDPETGLAFKRAESCTTLEKQAAYTVEEAKAFIEKWNAKIK